MDMGRGKMGEKEKNKVKGKNKGRNGIKDMKKERNCLDKILM
jgi:hypothetical protein